MRSYWIGFASALAIGCGAFLVMLSTEQSGADSIGVAGAVLLIGGMMSLAVLLPTARLWDGLSALRPLAGKTKEEIGELIGVPKQTERTLNDAVTLATWRTLWFSITLEFTDNVCTGVVRQSSI